MASFLNACACGDGDVSTDRGTDYEDGFTSKYTVSTIHSAATSQNTDLDADVDTDDCRSDTDDCGSESSEDSKVLNTSYFRATPLFREIEKENWEGVLRFLTTGKWTSSLLISNNEHLKSPAPSLQVKTWITAYDQEGVPEWSQLPLHAAISYSAPIVVVQKLTSLYPKSIQCTDNEGMLPIHLAFGFGAQESVLNLLLESFPTSINERGLGGRYPYECCELGPNKDRGRVYKVVAEQITSRTRQEVDNEWKAFAYRACEQIGLNDSTAQRIANKTLTETMLELLKDRKELLDIKEAAGERLTATRSGTPTTPTTTATRNKSHKKRSGYGRSYAGTATTATRGGETTTDYTRSTQQHTNATTRGEHRDLPPRSSTRSRASPRTVTSKSTLTGTQTQTRTRSSVGGARSIITGYKSLTSTLPSKRTEYNTVNGSSANNSICVNSHIGELTSSTRGTFARKNLGRKERGGRRGRGRFGRKSNE